MNVKDIDLSAFNNKKMPDGLTYYEMKYFQAIRNLYSQFKRGYITEEDALSEKTKLEAVFRQEEQYVDSFSKKQCELYNNVTKSEELRIEINKCDDPAKKLELALKCISLLTGDKLFYSENKARSD